MPGIHEGECKYEACILKATGRAGNFIELFPNLLKLTPSGVLHVHDKPYSNCCTCARKCVCVCMCVCVCVCVCVCACVCVCVCVLVCVCVCMCVCMCVHVCERVCVYVCVCLYVNAWI